MQAGAYSTAWLRFTVGAAVCGLGHGSFLSLDVLLPTARRLSDAGSGHPRTGEVLTRKPCGPRSVDAVSGTWCMERPCNQWIQEQLVCATTGSVSIKILIDADVCC